MSLSFSTIGREFTVRVKLAELSGRDRVELFRELMDALGITDRMNAEPNATARAQEIITEQWTAHWR